MIRVAEKGGKAPGRPPERRGPRFSAGKYSADGRLTGHPGMGSRIQAHRLGLDLVQVPSYDPAYLWRLTSDDTDVSEKRPKLQERL